MDEADGKRHVVALSARIVGMPRLSRSIVTGPAMPATCNFAVELRQAGGHLAMRPPAGCHYDYDKEHHGHATICRIRLRIGNITIWPERAKNRGRMETERCNPDAAILS